MPEMRNEDGKLALPGVRLPGDPVSEKEKSPALYYLGRMISGIKEMRVGRDAHIPPRTPAVWDDAKSGGSDEGIAPYATHAPHADSCPRRPNVGHARRVHQTRKHSSLL